MDVVILLIIIFGVIIFVMNNSAKEEEEKEKIEENNKIIEQKFIEENNIPEDANEICCTNMIIQETPTEGKFNGFIWIEEDKLFIYGKSIRKIEIHIESIRYYNRIGDYRIDTVTEGGGVNIGNAILGGIVGAIIGAILMGVMGMIVAFGIGALLAGRNKTITKNKEIDNRKTYLYYSEDNEDKKMVLTSEAYEVLLKLISKKEISYIENNKIIKSDNLQKDNVYKDIEKLSDLKDKGILTEDEFNSKKQLLLDKIQ